MKELVLDISKFDKGIDLNEWKKKRNLFGVILKVGGNEGGRYKDSTFETHYANAKAAGLHIGFYYYTTVTTVEDAAADAVHMMQLVNGKSYDLPWYMDVEDPGQFRLSARQLTNVIKSFCNKLRDNDIYSGLYTGGNAWLNNMYSSELMDYANWIAWWRSTWPSEAGDIGMWQQGGIRLSDGKIIYDDASGYHDCDWCIVDYPTRIKEGWSGRPAIEVVDDKPAIEVVDDKPAIEVVDDKPAIEVIQNGSSKETIVGGRASDVIGAAYGELGYYAPNDPERGSKYGRWLAEVTGEDWLAGPSTEIFWCCMFASWCLDRGGVKMDGFPTQNTDIALNNGAKKYAVDKYDVRYGDVVIFNWDWNNTTDHIGFATGEFDGSGFTTIEGNVGNAVKEKYRQMGNVAYVLRPPYAGYGVVDGNTPTVDTNPKNNRDGGKLDLDGIGGWNTIIDLQHVLGTVEDGWISGQDKKFKDNHCGMCNVTYEGNGSPMVKALQQKIGVYADGLWGANTSRSFQQWLIKLGYPVAVDGYFGRESVTALQQSLNDGKWK